MEPVTAGQAAAPYWLEPNLHSQAGINVSTGTTALDSRPSPGSSDRGLGAGRTGVWMCGGVYITDWRRPALPPPPRPPSHRAVPEPCQFPQGRLCGGLGWGWSKCYSWDHVPSQGILGVWDGHIDPTLGHCHYFCTSPWICPFTKHLLCAGTEARAVNKPDLIHPVAPKTSENKRNA